MKIDGWMRFPSPAQSDFPRKVQRETEAYIRKLTFAFQPVKAEAAPARIYSRYGRLAEMQLRIIPPAIANWNVSHDSQIDLQTNAAGKPEAA
jgi:hypothetical protein